MTVYRNLVIDAAFPATDIWLGDNEGHFVQKGTGKLDTNLLEGYYIVEFGLGSTTYPIHLQADAHYTEAEIKRSPSCRRPTPNIES